MRQHETWVTSFNKIIEGSAMSKLLGKFEHLGDKEDLRQDIWEQVVVKQIWDVYDPSKGSLQWYLLMVARNLLISKYKKRYVGIPVEEKDYLMQNNLSPEILIPNSRGYPGDKKCSDEHSLGLHFEMIPASTTEIDDALRAASMESFEEYLKNKVRSFYRKFETPMGVLPRNSYGCWKLLYGGYSPKDIGLIFGIPRYRVIAYLKEAYQLLEFFTM